MLIKRKMRNIQKKIFIKHKHFYCSRLTTVKMSRTKSVWNVKIE